MSKVWAVDKQINHSKVYFPLIKLFFYIEGIPCVFMSFLPFLEMLLYLHFIPAENVEQLYKEILNVQIWDLRAAVVTGNTAWMLLTMRILFRIVRVCGVVVGCSVILYTLPSTNNTIDILWYKWSVNILSLCAFPVLWSMYFYLYEPVSIRKKSTACLQHD